jgi:hypothetical protein
MGSYPLAALHLNPPPAQPDPLEQYQRLMQIHQQQAMQPLQQQAAQQQVETGAADLQIKNQQIKDQQGLTAAMQHWDGKDYNDILPLAVKNGVSAQTVMGLKSKILEQQQSLSTAAKNNADAVTAQLTAAKTKGDLLDGALTPLIDPKQTPDAALPQAVTQTAQDLVQKGLLDPQHAQQVGQLLQSGDPAQIRQQLDVMRKSNLAQSQILEEGAKQAGITKDNAQAADATANAAKTNMEVQTGASPAMADARYRNILMAQQQGKPVSSDDSAFLKAYQKQKTLVPTANFNLQNAGIGGSGGQPSALAQSVASGQMKWSDVISPRTPMGVKQQFAAEVKAINPNFNSGDFTVEQKAREAFTSGNYSQQLNSINTAREHMKTFTSLADALDNGNVQALNSAGNAIGMQFGSDKATNFNIAKQAFSAEVAKAFSGAGVTEGDRKEIGDKISSASSPAQLKGAAKVADALLAGKQTALQQTYRQSQEGSPNFGNGGGQTGATPSVGGFWSQIPGAVPH